MSTKTYTLVGTHWDRGVTFTEEVEATSACAAVSIADDRRARNNKLRANTWITTPNS